MQAELKKIIVKVIKEKSLIGNTEVSKTARGKIISKGPTCECTAKEGDIILFSGNAGANFEYESEEYLVLNQDEVFVIL